MAIPESEFITNINRFQLLSLATKEGIWEYDFITNKSFYNNGITALFGHSYPELEDNNTWWRNNIHPQDKNRIINALDELLQGNQNVWWGKYQFRCKDGNYKLILDRLFVVRDAQNKPIRLIGTMQDLTELNSLEQEFETIRKAHQQSMQKAIFEAEENERKKISEELYENINQVLSAINLHIAQAKNHVNNEGLAWLEEAQILLLESISGICILSKTLSPVSLQLLGLRLALDESLANVKETHQIDYTLLVDNVDLSKINFGLQTVFYRIAQHQLQNIIKHSAATNIIIKFSAQGEKTKMSIFDNGKGIDLKKVSFGNGFSAIQQKSAAFGGTFNLESIEGKTGFTMEVIM